jgi:tetratricopeptide (TPR) repeat protein
MKIKHIGGVGLALLALGWGAWCWGADPHDEVIDRRAALSEKAHPGIDDFLAAAKALSAGKNDDCLASLNKAIQAEGNRPLYHLARGSFLIVMGKSGDAAADLAATHGPDPGGFLTSGVMGQSELPMWKAVVEQLSGKAPPTTPGRVAFRFTPNLPLEGAVQKWLAAGGGAGPAQTEVLRHMAARWETVPDALPLLMKEARGAVAQGHGKDELPTLRTLGVVLGDDLPWLAVDADAHLASGDWGMARSEYDKLLIRESDNPKAYLGHAWACAQLGSIPRAKEDLAEAAALDPAAAAAFHQQHDADLAALASALPKETPAALSQQLLAAAKAGEDDEKLVQKALLLRKAMNVQRRVPEERYIEGERRRLNAINANPKDTAGYADMATYIYLNALDKHGHGAANDLEWEHDRITAMTDADAALKLDPQNITAMATKGWLLEQDNQEKDALTIAENGLQIVPGYPRLANLQNTLLQVSAIRAEIEAGKLRAPKSGMIFTPDAIITWTRGPTEGELEAARKYDGMSSANVATANNDIVTGWRKFGDDVEQMDVVADYIDMQGQEQDAINLWKKVLTLDPENVTALGDLQDVYKDAHLPDDALEMEFRLDNVFATSVNALLQKAVADEKAQNPDSAQAALDRAMATDPADARIYFDLARLHESDGPTMQAYMRSAIALVEAGARFNNATFVLGSPGPLLGVEWKVMTTLEQAQAKYFTRTGNTQQADQANQMVDDIKRRVALANAYDGAQDNGWAFRAARLQYERQLIADQEMNAAALFCLQVPVRNGSWHTEANREEYAVEYPVYRYLAPRLYHFQLWHFFGPGTLESYESAADKDANVPPAYHPQNIAE